MQTQPSDIDVVLTRADGFREIGEIGSARAAYLHAHRADPRRIYPLYWLAAIDEAAGSLETAYNFCRLAQEIDSDQIGVLLLLARLSAKLADDVTSLEALERVAQLDPDAPSIDALLADQYCRLGRLNEGIASFDRALFRDPDNVALQQNRLFVLNFSELLTPRERFDEHVAWGTRHEPRLRRYRTSHSVNRDPNRKLKLGYVSGDLRDHAVSSFIEPVLREHDRQHFDITCFDSSDYAEDAVTQRLRQYSGTWHRVSEIDDDALAKLIRACQIDILVDLAGHTRGNRLLTLARKPAPIQVTWLGYLNTTGLATMDYRITDRFLDPEGTTESLHTEKLVRLEAHACFEPWPHSPPLTASPSGGSAPLTYGSVNQWPKVTDSVKAIWGALLARDPSTSLLVVVRGGQHERVQNLVVNDFCRNGARKEQIRVSPFLETAEFLRLLSKIDIALDPFPYGGGTTTLQCLWMGVPVVTLRGTTTLSRNSVGILDAVGLSDLVTETSEDYATTVISLGRDRPRLARLRNELRFRLRSSRLMNAKAFTRTMESALRAMWFDYIRK